MSPIARALGLAALLSAPLYGVWSSALQRFFFHWSLRDTAALCTGLAILVLAILGAEWVARKFRGPLGTRIRGSGFLLLTLLALVSLVAEPDRFLPTSELVAALLLAAPAVIATGGSAVGRKIRGAIGGWGGRSSARTRAFAWALLPAGAIFLVHVHPAVAELVRAVIAPPPPWIRGIALIGIFAAVWHVAGPAAWGVVTGTKYAISIASPLALLIPIHALFWSTWSPRDPAALPPGPGSAGPPIVLIILDEWSRFSILSDDGEVLPGHPAISEFAARGVTASRARSPGTWTFDAVPRLLVGRDGLLEIRSGGAIWVDSAGERPFRESGHLIARARAAGYRVRVVGFYLPYSRLFEGELAEVTAESSVRKAATYAGATVASLRRTIYFWHLPGVPALFQQEAWWGIPSYELTWYQKQDALADSTVAALSRLRAGELVIIHLPTPHPPLTRGPGGERVASPSPRDTAAQFAAYATQVRHVDRVFTRFWEAMGRSGERDSALIVVTSDHAWREVPDPALQIPERLLEVPLWLTWPGAPRGTIDPRPLCLTGLAVLFDLAFEGSRALRTRGTDALEAAHGATGCRAQVPHVWTSIWF